MRVLLVNPRLSNLYNPFPFPPLGLMILAANIRDKHQVLIFDQNAAIGNVRESFEDLIDRFRPQIVGVTSLTGKGIIDGLEISRIAKGKGLKVVWGGTHASMFPRQTLEDRLVDFVIIGEGEITFKELLEALEKKMPLSKIKGLAYKQNGKIRINSEREFIRNLDDFPMPAWDLVDVGKYLFSFKGAKRKIEIFTSRGCPFRCAFCYNLKFNKRRWRGRSAPKIIEEIRMLKKKYKIDSVRFADDLFTVDKQRVREFCDLNQKVGITWDANSRVSDIDESFLETIEKGGCRRLTFGIETGSERVMKFLNKDLTVEQCTKTFDLLDKTNIMTAAAFIIGLPTETKKEADKTLNFARTIKASHVHVYPYVPYPGSVLSEICVEKGWIKYPETLAGWGNYSYAQERKSLFKEKEIGRIGMYFQLRNFYKSVTRGEWGIIRNFVGRKGFLIIQELIITWLGRKLTQKSESDRSINAVK